MKDADPIARCSSCGWSLPRRPMERYLEVLASEDIERSIRWAAEQFIASHDDDKPDCDGEVDILV